MGGQELVQMVVCRRAEEALKEVRRYCPNATIRTQVSQGRGIITLYQDCFIISKEFVETAETLSSVHCMTEYQRVLQGKARLVLIVPKPHAVRTRMRLLEFNNWWLFYYQVFFYDEQGYIKYVDRKTLCELMGRPCEASPIAPEIV